MGWAQEGFAELRTKSAKFNGDGASKDEADKIARDVKSGHPVFKKLSVVDGEEDWDFEATYNPTVTEDGPDKKEIEDDKNAGQLLTPSSIAAHENLKIDRDEGSSSKVGYDAQTEGGTKGIIVSSVGGNPYSRDIVDGKKEKGVEFNTLKPKSVGDRKKHIDKNQTHANYKVTQSDLDFSGSTADIFVVKYDYTIEQEGHAPEVRSFTVSINPKDKTQLIQGENLAVKDPGRGYTDSASNVALIEKLADAYGLDPSEIEIQFNASHLIADWFNGSGYGSAYNTLNASSEYNKKMTAVEKSIESQLKANETLLVKGHEKGAYMTFDMDVNVNIEEMKNSSIFTNISSKLTEANGVESAEEKTAILE